MKIFLEFPGKMNKQILYVPELTEITKFTFESVNMQLLELSYKECSTHILSIFKDIKVSFLIKLSCNFLK